MDEKQIRRILYIEDDASMIDLVSLILNRKGFQVLGANGGIEGLVYVKKEKPDLILLDLMMPDLDGWDLYQQLKADPNTKSIPVIVITAKSQSIDRTLGLYVAKVDDYLTKPFHPDELVASIEKIFSK
jgi:two-component system response regulator VicR